jgi:hypothetical protein
MDISHGYVAWISLDMSGYLSEISCGYLFLDISERYPILPKDIQEISFHIQRYPTISRNIQRYPEISRWGELPDDGVLFTSLFNEKLRVPEEYIAATVGLWKKFQSLRGAAGNRCQRLIAEHAAAKKKVESKIRFMKVPEGPKVPRNSSGSKSKGFVIPDADLPSTSENEEEVPSLVAVHGYSCSDSHFLQTTAPHTKATPPLTIDNDEDFAEEVL